ncbi:MAG: tetratricopeptide repeat protein [Micavibrio sp.]|nr:tetratricopeptide repeat protein [Micavibrio sp.]
MSDLMNEIDDDLRRQKLEAFWQENRNWIIGGILLAICSTAGMTWWRSYDYQKNLVQTQGLIQAIESGDAAKLGTYAGESDRNHAALARLVEAGLLVRDGKQAEAIKAYDDVSGTMGADSALRDLAHLLSIGQRLNTDTPQKLHGEIEKLSGDGDAFRYSALEMDALLYAREKNMKMAIDRLSVIAAGADAPDDVRTRAVTLRELYTASLNEPAAAKDADKADKKDK